jgi:hypothetical protein
MELTFYHVAGNGRKQNKYIHKGKRKLHRDTGYKIHTVYDTEVW